MNGAAVSIIWLWVSAVLMASVITLWVRVYRRTTSVPSHLAKNARSAREQVKLAGHRTGMRILLFVNLKPLQHEVKRRPPVLPVAVAFVSCLGLSACASNKQADAWQQDKPVVIASMQKLQGEQQSMKDEISNLQRRMIELEQKQAAQSSIVDTQNASILQLQTSTAHLKVVAAKSKKSSRITKQKLVKKLNKIAKSISKPIVASPAHPREEEKNHYTAAYLALKSGRYKEATRSFRNLLKMFPKGEYVDQAWYWLGESYYAQHRLKQAIHAFETIAKHYPKSAKHAAALLKLGLAYQDASRLRDARVTLQRLIQKHSDSAAAEQARSQLRLMQKKKR